LANDKFLIDLEPIGRRIAVEAGISLLEAAQQAGVDLVAACGGIGICGTCRARPVRGEFNPLTPGEEEQLDAGQIAAGYRLACQAVPRSDARVEIPPESLPAPQKIQIEGRQADVALQPAVQSVDLLLPVPDLHDLRSDLKRVQDALAGADLLQGRDAKSPAPSSLGCASPTDDLATQGRDAKSCVSTSDLAALEQLSNELRKNEWGVRLAVKNSRLAGTFARGTPLLGLAVDLGSTKLAVYLVNLETGATLAQSGVMNPQIAYGEDVVNRIAFANRGEGNRRMLQERVIETLNGAATELCARAHALPAQIVEAVVVGNTAMHHFFTHLPVAQLGAAPYVAAVNQPLEVRTAELGLKFSPGAQVYLPANIAGYVGGDHTAALLATRSFPGPKRVLVDIGTNTEISLVSGGEIYSCSTASGPAFEGAHIHDGMRAAPGAIERVHVRDGRAQVWTIGGLAPVGICGSGILQAVAELLTAGVIDRRGTLRKDAAGVRAAQGKAEFLLVAAAQTGHGRDIVITRRDINEIQLAKGAIRAGIEIMLHKGGLKAGEVDEWVIAGAFGTYLDLASAVRVGMFPDVPLERFHQVGNAAGMGAKQMLLSLSERAEATRLAALAHYVELTVEPTFTDEFMQAMYL
jgi:uncharacterized 2Fe-2S/4Fe-4S cluster protein (DUF4445 family)